MRIPVQLATTLWRFVRDDGGPTAVEYAVLLALIVLCAAAAIRAVGAKMQVLYEAINTAVPT